MIFEKISFAQWGVVVLTVSLLTMIGRGDGENGPSVGNAPSEASGPNSTTVPATTRPQEGEAMRHEFLVIKRPLVVEYKDYTIPPHTGKVYLPERPASHIVANDELKKFIRKYSPKDVLAKVVLPLLDDAKYSADACILFILEREPENDNSALTMHQSGYISPDRPGKWGQKPYDSKPGVIKQYTLIALESIPDTQPGTQTAPAEKP